MKGVVMIHPEMGIYLGNMWGLGFFSNLDCAGQTTAVVFPSKREAADHLETWGENSDPDLYRFADVEAAEQWASIEELEAAGLGELVGPMKAERLSNMGVAGSA